MNRDNQPVTKRDLRELVTKKEFKEELKKLATKDDLKKLATKEELKNLATKEELKKLATKDELKKDINGLRVDLVKKMVDLEFKFEKRFGEVDQKIDDKFSKVLDGQDKIMGELRTMREEHSLSSRRVYDNAGRIEKIEEKVGIKTNYEL